MFERLAVIADLHLSPQEPEKTLRFLAFLDHAVKEYPALLILGDLFEYWIGPKHEGLPDFQPVLEALRRTSAGGCRVFFLAGNRDFLFHEATGARHGVEVMREPKFVQLHERRICLMHGDLLCREDKAYLRMRRLLQNPPAKWLARRLPLGASMRMAGWLRRKSMTATPRKTLSMMDLTPSAVTAVFERGADVLICGHVHKPRHESRTVNGRPCELLVVGAWEGPAQYVDYRDGRFSLRTWE